MILEIEHSRHFDLLFHALAYLQVDNASNLYCEEYIAQMGITKRRFGYDIQPNIKLLQAYYNANFERLALINFLPYFSEGFEDMKGLLAHCQHFTQGDLQHFVTPFIKILDAESAFYFDYWDALHRDNENKRHAAERGLQSELAKYSCIFEFYNKSAMTFLSYSLTRNGRGFNANPSCFDALVPFPKDDESVKSSFFALLHEYTHQFTDVLLNANISMTDNTHNIAEKAAILADYYLIKVISPCDLPTYFEWVAQNGGNQSGGGNERDFLSSYSVDDKLKSDLQKLAENIIDN